MQLLDSVIFDLNGSEFTKILDINIFISESLNLNWEDKRLFLLILFINYFHIRNFGKIKVNPNINMIK